MLTAHVILSSSQFDRMMVSVRKQTNKQTKNKTKKKGNVNVQQSIFFSVKERTKEKI